MFLKEEDGDPTTQIHLLRIGSLQPLVQLELPFLRHPDMCSVLSDRPPLDSPNPLKDYHTGPYIIEETASKIFILEMDDLDRHIFVAVGPLIKLLEKAEATHAQSPATAQVDYYSWSAWGPENTFWLQPFAMEPGFTSVSGSRVCSISHIKRLFDTEVVSDEENMGIVRSNTLGTEIVEEGTTILVMDFNMRPVERANGKTGGGASAYADRIRWETEVEGEIVVSTLPFRTFQIEQASYAYIELIATPDHIIGIRVRTIPNLVLQDTDAPKDGETEENQFYDVLQFTE